MATQDLPSVSFDPLNLDLRTVYRYFAQEDEALVDVEWQDWVKRGAQVRANRVLGAFLWDTGEFSDFKAPVGCNGTIRRVQRDIDASEAHLIPLLLFTLKK